MKLIEKSKKIFVALVATGIVMGPQAGFAAGTVVLNGAGATFPAPIYTKWFSVYHDAHSDVEINYQAIGSGGGILPRPQGRATRLPHWLLPKAWDPAASRAAGGESPVS